MILTHYFPSLKENQTLPKRELFKSFTEYTTLEQEAIATQLSCCSGRALCRFSQLDKYIERRNLTEQWLYAAFLKIGGRPLSPHPFYFVLGENKQLKQDFGLNAGELILDTTQINKFDISFTLGDSVGLYFSSGQRQLYSLEEIETVSGNSTFVREQMALLEQHHHYIEAQLWNKSYLSKARIIKYYPVKRYFPLPSHSMMG